MYSYAPYATDNVLFAQEGFMHPDSVAPVNKNLEASLKGPR